MCGPKPAALPANGGSGDSDAAQVVSRAQEEEQCSVACFTSSMPDQDPVDVARLAQFIYRHIEEAADVASMGCDQALTGLVELTVAKWGSVLRAGDSGTAEGEAHSTQRKERGNVDRQHPEPHPHRDRGEESPFGAAIQQPSSGCRTGPQDHPPQR